MRGGSPPYSIFLKFQDCSNVAKRSSTSPSQPRRRGQLQTILSLKRGPDTRQGGELVEKATGKGGEGGSSTVKVTQRVSGKDTSVSSSGG